MTLYAVTIFLSAFLLFQVQPLIAKMILPWFGGSAAVWSAALLFFQLCLLLGYAYAHFITKILSPKMQMRVHVILLAASCALLPILPSPYWKPDAAGDPTGRILLLLGATIGLQYLLLSATSPLVQAWYVRTTGSKIPYRLFALSNFGSLLALVSFPFLVEPRLSSRHQAFTWSGLYVLFALLCATTAWMSKEEQAGAAAEPEPEVTAEQQPPPALSQKLLWVALSACASALLVAITNHLSQNVAPIPLLWVLPLTLYLLSFILSFESDRIYQRWIFLPWVAPALAWMAYLIYAGSGNIHIKYIIPVFAVGLFFCCMMCHGELARRRPAPQYLTSFYLMVSVGGAIGGIFVAIVSPHVFRNYLETQIGLIACAALAAIVLWNLEIPKLGAWPVRILLLIGVGTLAGYLGRKELADRKGYVLLERNFYGALRVYDDMPGELYAQRQLTNGTINHGSQILDDSMRYTNTSYYGDMSGVGRAMHMLQAKGPVRYGVIGLGAGVLSNYSRAGDYVRVFDINPLVEQIAQHEFTFFPHSQADKKIVMGDARLSLERMEPQNFDLLAVDAFSSDAIPIHLLTREAMQLYAHHLKPDGILALHISNRYLNLEPVCARDAEALDRHAWTVSDDGGAGEYLSSSTWVLVTSDANLPKKPQFINADIVASKVTSRFRAWTDDYSNIIQILRLD
jgi:spermidine synthase